MLCFRFASYGILCNEPVPDRRMSTWIRKDAYYAHFLPGKRVKGNEFFFKFNGPKNLDINEFHLF